MSAPHVVFTARGHRFALPVTSVRKVRPLARVTRIPGTPRHVAGAMNDEGTVVTVVDLAVRLGAALPTQGDPWVVVLDAPHAEVGLLVEAVEDVVPLAPTEATPDADIGPLVTGALVAVPPPAHAADQAADEAGGRDDAAWLRHTLAESARIMGFRTFAIPAPPSNDTATAAPAWRLDTARVLQGGDP